MNLEEWCTLRTFFGYLMILITIPIFIALLFLTTAESKTVRSFNDVLDEKIEISPINLKQTSFINDKNENIVSQLYKDENRIYLSIDDVPKFLIDLFIESEDKHFYDHLGFDLTAIGRALAINIKANEVEQGASTITQQLARNQFLTHEKTYNRKLSEVLYAYGLERAFSKDQLLELYINTIYFQNGNYGIEAAAQYYFQQSTAELTKAELAFLAAIPNNPTLYNPLTNFNKTKERQERLLKKLNESGLITKKEFKSISAEKIMLNVKNKTNLYPDYTTYVEAEFKQLIAEKEGFNKRLKNAKEKERKNIEQQLNDRVEELLQTGLTIHTALDPNLQTKTVNAVNKRLPYNDVQGAAAVINNETNKIVALSGGKQYKKYDFNRAFQAIRQPGSTIKPLIAYAPYFERTKASIYESINADSFCIGKYCPKNYGGGQYGNVTLETAFIHSFNTPAVRLLQRVGIEEAFSDLKPFNFTHVSKSDYHYPAAIGGFTYGMSPLELTSAFTVFANDGFYKQPRAITKVTDSDGHLLYKWEDDNIKVWNIQTVNKLNDLMSKTVQSGTARKANINKQYVGGKTGTSNDYKDLWFVGLTDELTAGVWVGKDKGGNVESINSTSPQILIWRDIVN